MAAPVRDMPRAVRVALLSPDPAWRAVFAERLAPVEDLRIVRVGDSGAEEDVEAALDHDVDVVLWDSLDPSPGQSALVRRWREGGGPHRPALVVAAPSLTPDLYRTGLALGACDVVLRDSALPELTESLYRSARREGRAVPARSAAGEAAAGQGLVVATFALRGGVGKTAVAIELAAALRRRLLRGTALIDLALPAGSVGTALSLAPARPLGDLLGESASLDGEMLRTYLTSHAASGIHVLCTPESAEVAEYVRKVHVDAILAAARSTFRATVVDTGSALGETDFAVAQAADTLLLIVGPDLPSTAAARLALDLFDRFEIPRGKVGLVLNRWRHGAPQQRDLERALGVPVWAHVAEDPGALTAMNGGVPVYHVRRRGPLVAASETLAARLVDAGSLPPDRRQAGGRLSDRLPGRRTR